MNNGISKMYGPTPAIDHFNVNDVLQKAQTITSDAGNIVNVLRKQVNDIVSPRQYSPYPAPAPAMNLSYLKPAEKLATVNTVSPWLIVVILATVIALVWFIKK